MAHQIFTDAWLQLSAKEKRAHLEGKLFGLRPAVVYLDDEPEALEVFSLRCQELGLEAVCSTDPKELLSFIAHNKSRVLLVVSDYKMPEVSGFDFREKVLEISVDIPFYILSGYVDRELALQGVKLKISGFVEKPMRKEAFMDILRSEGETRGISIRDDYEMLKSFTDDVVNIVAEVEEGCLHLETDPRDSETVARIFGLVHTVKGSSGFFEPRTLHLFAHGFEEILKLVQAGQLQVTTPLISSWLKACDIIKTLNEEFMTGEHKDYDVDKLKSVLKVDATANARVSTPEGEPEYHAEKKSDAKDSNKPADIKVSMHVLDEFTQVSGELTVIRNMINKVVGAIEKTHPGDKDVQVLSELLDEMHKINSDMQTKITDIRRVTATQLVKPLSRNMRDTSKALGKEVDFVVEGEELRLDNAIADTLSRCLVHLMRNSLDHGLEGTDERKAAGKSPKGKLALRFESVNETIVVTLEDDGRGINTDKIRQKVISQGLRSAQAAHAMSDEELHLMIFEAGFSTAAQVTEFSGRGVGMSMVKETIEAQHGKIRIHSEKGKGSRFILEIPIPKSVLITNCLFVTAGKNTFGIPQEFVVRVLDERALGSHGVERLESSQFIRFEGHLVPVISLAKTLGLAPEDEHLLVVLDANGHIFALEVGEVHDTEDAVIKQLNINILKSLAVYQGGTFLGDGTVGLIMDVPGLAAKLSLKKSVNQKRSQEIVTTGPKLENVISFALHSPGSFAIPEKDVFRVEVLSRDHVVESGGALVMPYRDSMMTLVHIEELLFKRSVDASPEVKALPTLIVRHGDQYLGLLVKEIRDLEAVEMKIVPALRKKPGLAGNLIHKDSSLALVELGELQELLAQQVPAADELDLAA